MMLANIDGSFVANMTTILAPQRRISMSKGNDKKPKSDKSKPKIGISPYKAARVRGNSRSPRSPKSQDVSGSRGAEWMAHSDAPRIGGSVIRLGAWI